MTTASKISVVSDGQAASDVLLLGAAGNSGQLIAAELAARGLSIRLAGRRGGPLEDLARVLAADGAATQVRTEMPAMRRRWPMQWQASEWSYLRSVRVPGRPAR